MSDGEIDVDLAECAREPIHLPGSIQPDGVLLGLDGDEVVVRASANASGVLGVEPLGAHVTDLVEGWEPGGLGDDLEGVNPLPLRIGGEAWDGIVHRTGGLLVLEVEPGEAEAEAVATSFHRMRRVLHRLQGAGSLEELAELTCAEVRRMTGFDRVMLYRFNEAYEGEVVAEHRRDDLEPFLGLRYPASDIPPQARALYLTHWQRLIGDVGYVPSPIRPEPTGLDGEPLDLGAAVLRSVSPVHVEYLRNMGVAASMSISLVDRDRLWGLIACHHYRGPRRPPFRVRAAAELVGRTMSLLLSTTQTAGAYERALAVRAAEGRILERLADPTVEAVPALLGGHEVLDVVGATGLVLRVDGATTTYGDVPGGFDAAPVARRLLADGDVGAASDLGSAVPEAAGALAARIGGGLDHWALWLRPEIVRTVTWGGDPRNKVTRDGDRLSPRRSFEAWTETVRGRSDPWTDEDRETAHRVAASIAASMLRRTRARAAVADTVQRTILLEELPEVPGARIAARYAPSADAAIGGDWYDLFFLPDGRVAIAVGDVAGHGLEAAPVMAQLRHGLRAYLLQEPSPGRALARLNGLASHLLPADLASVVVADLEPRTRRLRIASAGHLPALVVRDGRPELVDGARGPALGVAASPVYEDVEVVLPPGGSVFLYTDGLVESRGEAIDVGLDRLLEAAAALPDDVEAACDVLLANRPPSSDDDATLLALRTVDLDGTSP